MRNDTCALILIFLFPQPSIVVRLFSQRLPRSRAGPLARPTPVRESGSGGLAGSGTGGPRAGGGAPRGKEGERWGLRSGSGGGDQEGTAAPGLVASLLGLGISAESIADGCLSGSHGVPPRRCSGAASTTASDGPL